MPVPRMTQVFNEAMAPDSPEFRAWFRNSKVVDASGQPLVVYHSTRAQDFDAFRTGHDEDLGQHFGSAAAAQTRWSQTADDESEPTGRTYPVYLSIQNPVKLQDTGVWEADGIARQLRLQGVFSTEEFDRIASMADKSRAMRAVQDLLQKKGHDGARYKNDVEDPGSTSWIIFYPWQAKSVHNRGTWDRRRADILE